MKKYFLWGRKFLKILKIFEKIENFRNHDFSIFKGISIIFEKSHFENFRIFQKKSKIFDVSTLGARRSGPDKRIFSILFLKLCGIFVRERTRRLEVTQTRLEQHNPQNSFCWTALTTH